MKRKLLCELLVLSAALSAMAVNQAKVVRQIDTVLLPRRYKYVKPTFYDYDVPGSGYTEVIDTPKNATPEGRLVEAIVSGDVKAVVQILNAGLDLNKVILFQKGDRAIRYEIENEPLWSVTAPGDRPETDMKLIREQSLSGLSYVFNHHAYATIAGEMFGTPLMLAARVGNIEIAQLLLERGANPNIFIETKQKDFKLVEKDGMCIITGPGNTRTKVFALKEAYWPLAMAFWQSRGKIPNEQRICESCDKMADLLVKYGAALTPVDAPVDCVGQNALWDAAEMYSDRLLEIALNSGIDPMEEDKSGTNFLDVFFGMCRCAKAVAANSGDQRLLSICERFREVLLRQGVKLSEDTLRAPSVGDLDDEGYDPDFKVVPVCK